jgi:hypothetical protein
MKKILTLTTFCLLITSICFASFPVKPINNTVASSIDDSCDVIVKNNWEEISVKVIEITPDIIKYKKCSNLNGPLISILKSEVLAIKYHNGEKDVFDSSSSSQTGITAEDLYTKKRLNVCALLGFIFSFFIPIVGIILSAIGWKQCDKNPDKYKGKGLAIAGYWISFLTIMIITISILALI